MQALKEWYNNVITPIMKKEEIHFGGIDLFLKKYVMARMFAAEFSYKQATYTATVIISGIDGKKTIAIQVPESLYHIIPGGKVVVEAATGIQKPGRSISKDPALIESILAAVEKHEEDPPPVNIWN